MNDDRRGVWWIQLGPDALVVMMFPPGGGVELSVSLTTSSASDLREAAEVLELVGDLLQYPGGHGLLREEYGWRMSQQMPEEQIAQWEASCVAEAWN